MGSSLHALKETASIVELVMLLYSQEWQNSLQKHAGLAFIELVNEERLLAHASKDHIIKVANEADFILNQEEEEEEEELCDHFIKSSRQRYLTNASRLKEKFLSLMINDKTTYLNSSNPFWKLDIWEDDLRRRRRLISNPNGALHDEAKAKYLINETDDYMIETLHKCEYL
ncbi:unnamed protein product [Rotaria sp. Silwood2]|nr:unnamed protein product [Rotaria sp. Silwood2]CAF3072802.1 unnamed protein product [Rotaria sp. Silwood2]CAF3359019.1 unnamed protein product [Rotaria sp. Silwood2]CAF4205165.1 unnamed protein product [Rotaria sp. Silwood2]CAF4650928.1 unnamed protein product [Rotaria sp. Silwood2]